jgi:hypothetical protein
MNENDFNWSRRRFIAAGSAEIAAPIVMNMAGRVAGAAESASTGKKTYFINDMSWAAASGFLAGQNVGKRLKTA